MHFLSTLILPLLTTIAWAGPVALNKRLINGCDGINPPEAHKIWKISPGPSTNGYNYLTIQQADNSSPTNWGTAGITLPKCTKLTLDVINQSGEDLTLHFHGILQLGGQTLADGVQGLTQSAISVAADANDVSQRFTYQVLLDQEGSYWIHSHSPGQYPKGVKATLVVTNAGDPGMLGYDTGKDQTVTLSDWWPDFEAAHNRSVSIGNDRCGSTTDQNGYGIEFPSYRVLFNEVNGYDITLNEDNKVVTLDSCTSKKRVRFINTSSHARFYVWFADKRPFKVIELDGTTYTPASTTIAEVAAGQRISIVVGSNDTMSNCGGTYIMAAADTKVGHGTLRCPQTPTRGDRYPQFVHGYLEVSGQTNLAHVPVLNSGTGDKLTGTLAWNLDWLKTFSLAPGSGNSNYDKPVDGSTIQGYNKWVENRMDLPYKILYYNSADCSDYGYDGGSTRQQNTFLGVGGMEDTQMTPYYPEDKWMIGSDYSKALHYITLSTVVAGDNNGHGGYADMAENVRSGNTVRPWTSPDSQTKAYSQVPRDQIPELPSALRILNGALPDSKLTDPLSYNSSTDKNPGGRTIMIDSSQPNWFVLRSSIGDHPMHLHGHHFQILAKLSPAWFDKDAQSLINLITSGTNTAGKSGSNPPRRDTLMVEKDTTYVIAIKPDNPGVWAFHCHNDIHAAGTANGQPSPNAFGGMFSQVIERPQDLRKYYGTFTKGTGTGATPLKLSWNPGNGASGDVGPISSPENLASLAKNTITTALLRYGWSSGMVSGLWS